MIRLMLLAMLSIILGSPILGSMCRAEAAPHDDIAFEDVFTGFQFPKLLGSFMFQNRIQYDHVDLGYGVNYMERAGATATIIVYNLNQHGIANGTDDTRVVEEFAKMEEAIATVAQQGRYASFHRVESPRLSKAWLQMSHELVRPDGRRAHAYSFIRGQKGRFVKIRITTSSEGTFARLPVFLLGVSRAIGLLNDPG